MAQGKDGHAASMQSQVEIKKVNLLHCLKRNSPNRTKLLQHSQARWIACEGRQNFPPPLLNLHPPGWKFATLLKVHPLLNVHPRLKVYPPPPPWWNVCPLCWMSASLVVCLPPWWNVHSRESSVNFYIHVYVHVLSLVCSLAPLLSGWNNGRTSDIFRPFVALVRAKLDVFGQTVRATVIRLCLRWTPTKTGLSTVAANKKFTFRIRTMVVLRYEFHRSLYRSVFTLLEFRFVKTDIYRTFTVSFSVH